MSNFDTMIGCDVSLDDLRNFSKNRSVAWQLQAMTGNAKQDSGNGTFHGISALSQNNDYEKQELGRLVNYRVGVAICCPRASRQQRRNRVVTELQPVWRPRLHLQPVSGIR
jgi:hypothetical protein